MSRSSWDHMSKLSWAPGFRTSSRVFLNILPFLKSEVAKAVLTFLYITKLREILLFTYFLQGFLSAISA